jgi:hypothetical protein
MKRLLRVLGRAAFVLVGIVSAGMGLKGFLMSSRFIPALYSILTYATASKTIDFLLHGIEEYSDYDHLAKE